VTAAGGLGSALAGAAALRGAAPHAAARAAHASTEKGAAALNADPQR